MIESLCLEGLTLTVEKQNLTTSNVTELLSRLKGQDEDGITSA